jgi:hypothetical protein
LARLPKQLGHQPAQKQARRFPHEQQGRQHGLARPAL